MEICIATKKEAEDLYILNSLFNNDMEIELIKKSLNENKDEIVCIAYENNIAIGFCNGYIVRSMCYRDNRADIESLFVIEEYRGQGVGKTLITKLENAFYERGIRHFHISVNVNNVNALSLYRKIGYVESGEILLEKSLDT